MAKTSTTRKLLTLADAAAYIDFSTRYLQEQTAAGRIAVVKLPGGNGRRLANRWRPEDLDAWIEQHRVAAVTEVPQPPASTPRRRRQPDRGHRPSTAPRGAVNARDVILAKEGTAS